MTAIHAVLGAGPLAHHTAKALTNLDAEVRHIRRSGTGSASTRIVDLLDTQALANALSGVKVAYMCAQPAYHRWPQEFPPLLDSVMQACMRTGTALVMGDNLYMYGDAAHERPLTEHSATDATTRKGRVRSQMADALMAAHSSGSLQVAIARGSDFFGPGVKASALGDMVFAPLLHGKTVRACGDINLPHCYTYIGDFGAAMATLGTSGAGWGKVWHVPNSPAISTREVINRAAQLASLPAPRISASGRMMLSLVGLFIPAARETIELLPHFDKPYLVDDSAWRAAFALRETPLDEALLRTMAWYRQELDLPVAAGLQAG
jgi:nucleoside-diphosphate-sugar epimerase